MKTAVAASDNSLRKQRRGSCEPQMSSGSKKRRGSCEPEVSGSAGSARVKRRRDSASGSESSGSESSDSESGKMKARKKKRCKKSKSSFAAGVLGAAASIFGVKKE